MFFLAQSVHRLTASAERCMMYTQNGNDGIKGYFPGGASKKQLIGIKRRIKARDQKICSFPLFWQILGFLAPGLRKLSWHKIWKSWRGDAAPVAAKDAALPSSFLPCLLPGTCCVRYYCLSIKHLASLLPFLSRPSFFIPSFLPSFFPSFLPSFLPSFIHSFIHSLPSLLPCFLPSFLPSFPFFPFFPSLKDPR